jgi:hypothetical protein
MLGFCYESVRARCDRLGRGLRRLARGPQEGSRQPKPALESYFYLSNLYITAAIRGIEERPRRRERRPLSRRRSRSARNGISQFRAGKLYADSGNTEKASITTARRPPAFKKEANPPLEYYRRSLETVAAGGKGDPQEMADTWEKLLAMNPKMTDGDWNLGVASMRAGRFEKAKEAFERARQAGGDRGQDAYYASGLASGGIEVKQAGLKIPVKDKDGKVISSLSDEDLDTRIKAVVQEAGPLLNREASGGRVPARRERRRVASASRPRASSPRSWTGLHARFVAMVTEVLVRNKPRSRPRPSRAATPLSSSRPGRPLDERAPGPAGEARPKPPTRARPTRADRPASEPSRTLTARRAARRPLHPRPAHRPAGPALEAVRQIREEGMRKRVRSMPRTRHSTAIRKKPKPIRISMVRKICPRNGQMKYMRECSGRSTTKVTSVSTLSSRPCRACQRTKSLRPRRARRSPAGPCRRR